MSVRRDLVPPFQLLVADDDDGLRESLRLYLEAHGYAVSAAGSGSEAIVVARQERIDLAIVDYRIGDMTGLELFRHLRAMQPSAASILISAELETSMRAQARLAGFARCLPKPIVPDALRAAVAFVLRHPAGPFA